MQQGTALRVIQGGFDRPLTINGVTIHLFARERRLPAVDALLVEQDTCLLLDEGLDLNPADVRQPLSHAQLQQEHEYPQGTILPRSGQPLRLHAVLYHLGESPNWSRHAIEQVLDNLFALLPTLDLGSIALPALAHRHGDAPVSYFLSLLCNYLERRPPRWSGHLWVLLPRSELSQALTKLHCRHQARRA